MTGTPTKQLVPIDMNGLTILNGSAAAAAFASAAGDKVSAQLYGADPTGTTAIDTLIATLISNLPSGGGTIFLGEGTFKVSTGLVMALSSTKTIKLKGAAPRSTTLLYYGSGDCVQMADTVDTNAPRGDRSGIEDLTIDGIHATGNPVGIHFGDIFAPKITDVVITNFTGPSSIGLHGDNTTTWTEQGDYRVLIWNCSKGAVMEMTTGYDSFACSNFDLTFLQAGAQSCFTALNGAYVYNGKLTIRGHVNGSALARVQASTNITLSGTQTIDTVAVVAGDRVLATGQTTAANNGLLVVAAGGWSRPTDFAASSLQTQTFVFIAAGSASINTYWGLAGTVTVNTTAETWQQFDSHPAVIVCTGDGPGGSFGSGNLARIISMDFNVTISADTLSGAVPYLYPTIYLDSTTYGYMFANTGMMNFSNGPSSFQSMNPTSLPAASVGNFGSWVGPCLGDTTINPGNLLGIITIDNSQDIILRNAFNSATGTTAQTVTGMYAFISPGLYKIRVTVPMLPHGTTGSTQTLAFTWDGTATVYYSSWTISGGTTITTVVGSSLTLSSGASPTMTANGLLGIFEAYVTVTVAGNFQLTVKSTTSNDECTIPVGARMNLALSA